MGHLFEPAIYTSAQFPDPRAFQVDAHEKLRQGIREGHRCQMLMSPTGSGKTFLGLRIAHEALAKGRRAVFVCDRTTLINQTSETADRYGLSAHGVIQAQHWRYRPDMPFQIASAQTLARRQWPDADVIIVDEAHTQLSAWTEYIKDCRAAVIGLSATPFSVGLGRLFSNLVNATTMAALVESGVLVPMRVFTCTRADMAGAATAGGEWTDGAAEERGMEIVGDVVAEWTRFGEGRKTICFGATIKHCEELCRQFNDSGVMAAVFTAETTQEERARLLDEYRKPDSILRVLVSVEALAKGFDVPDVGCVIDCRPLRKSLSTAIQMWGRGLRSSPETGKQDCLARGTLVLTDRGEVAIEHVTRDHKVWDGENFVHHSGAVCRGVQKVIEYDGLIATPDHKVWTNDGWTRFEAAASGRIRIARTGLAGKPVRLSDDRVTRDARQWVQSACRGAVCALRWFALRAVQQHPQAARHRGVPTLQCATPGVGADVALPSMPGAVGAVHQPEVERLQSLRRAWGRISLFFGKRGGALGRCESRRAGPFDAVGSDRQQRSLRAGKSALDNEGRQSEQHQGVRREESLHHLPCCLPLGPVRRRDAGEASCDDDSKGDRRAMAAALAQTEREVWDVLNAGPLQRFTANGRLVHNCVLLDHSGNIIRFAEDFERIYHEGLDVLDAGEKLDKTIRRDDEDKEAKKCPKCGYSPFRKRCMACGHEHQTLDLTQHADGEMHEVMIGKRKLADDHRHLWEQVVSYARGASAPEKQYGRARHLYRDMTGREPPRHWRLEGTPSVPITRNVLNQIRSRNIAYAKARQKAVA